MPTMIGVKLLDRYQLVEQIGHGGMGVVYRAHDPLLDREVAVKMLPPGVMRPDTEERFRREARLVAQMDHPGIVPIFDFGQYLGSLFLIMPVVHGTTLRRLIESGALHVGEALEIVAQSAEALEYSHKRGVVHRDIKPENIMVSPDRDHLRVRLMDFGLARDTGHAKLTHSGGIVGTLSYMSPEQIQGGAVGASADLYALGAVLYECLAGEAPFVGPIYSLVPRIVQEIPRSLRGRGVEVDQELEDLILACLAKDPEARPSHARALADRLRHAAARLGGEFLGRVLGAPPAEKPAPSPFFGRQAELQAILDRLPPVLAGESQLVLVEGDAGMGKTRLLEEVAGQFRPRGIRVLRGRLADRQNALPYQGLCELVQDGLRSRDTTATSAAVGELAELASELVARFPLLAEVDELRSLAVPAAGIAPPLAGPVEIAQLFARALQRLATGRSLAIFLEDLHLGEASLEALDHLLAFLAGSATLVVLTWRPGEVDGSSRLARLLARWRNDPRALRLRLEPLEGEPFTRLVQHLLSADEVAADVVERLHQASEGNPLFLRELIRRWRDHSDLRRQPDGSWSFSESRVLFSGEALPEAVQEAVERHLDHLPALHRRLLELAAVLGRRFDFDDLVALVADEGLTGVDSAVAQALSTEKLVEKLVEAMIHSGVLVEQRRGFLSFASLLHREVLYHRLSRRERRLLHRKAVELLEKRSAGRHEKLLAELFHHSAEAELAEKTVVYGVELARRHLLHSHSEQARDVARRALDQIEDDPDQIRAHGELLAVLSEAHRQLGELPKALMSGEQAFQAFDGADLLGEAAGAAAFVAEVAWQARQADLTRSWTERGLELARAAMAGNTLDAASGTVAATLERLLVLAATVANLRGEHEEAQVFLDELERRQRTSSPSEVLLAGGTLRVAMAPATLELDPLVASQREELEIAALVFDLLVESSGDTSSAILESALMAADGRRCELRLRAGITFSDGAPLNAQAIKSSLERAARARRGRLPAALAALDGILPFIHGSAAEIRGLEVLDEGTLLCELGEPLPIFPWLLSDPTLRVVREKVEPSGHRRLVGSNAFVVETVDRARLVLQTRRPRSGGSPSRFARLDRIELDLGLDSARAAAALRQGDLDLAGDFRGDEAEALMRDLRHRGSFVELPRQSVVFALLRQTLPVEIRQLLIGTTDVLELVRQTGRLTQPAFGLLPPGVLGHDPGRRSPPRAILGQTLAGSRQDYSALTLRAGVDQRLWERHRPFFERLFETWGRLGFELDWQFFDLPPRADRADYDLLFLRATAASDDPDEIAFGNFHSKRGRLRAYYGREETDLWLEEARVDTRPAARIALYRRFEDDLGASQLFLPLFFEVDIRVGGPFLRGLKLSPRPPFVDYFQLAKAQLADEATAPRPRGGEIEIALPGRPEEIDPRRGLWSDNIETMATVFETLTRVEEGARIVPWLAEGWEARGGGARYQFRLREGIRFHDGRRLSTRDVRFTFERLLRTPSPELHFPLLPIRGARAFRDGQAPTLAGIELLSAQEILFELDTPIAFFPSLLSHALTSILPEGTEIPRGTWRDGCVGTGPFRVLYFDPGRRLELERNPDYWRPQYPKADRLSFRLGIPPEKIAEDFRLGRLSLASDLRPQDVEALRRDPEFAAGYRETPRLATYFLVLDPRHPPFSDRDLRLAFVASLDFTTPLQAAGRLAVRAHGLIPPGLLGYESKPPMPPPPPGEPVTLASFLRVAQHPVWRGAYAPFWQQLREKWRESWYEIDALEVPADQALKIFRDGNADLLAYRWVADYPDTDGFLANLLHSEEGSLGKTLQRPELDGAIERARLETEPSLRHVLYREIDDWLVREGLVVPLFHEQIYRFRHPSVRGLRFGMNIPEVRYEELHVRR